MPTAASLDELIARKAVEFADQVKKTAALADKEEEIRVAVEQQLAFIEKEAGVELHGKQEFTVAKGRVDSVYSRVLIEYKNPSNPGARIGPKADSPGAKKVVEQIKSRFRGLKDEHGQPFESLFGVGLDGNHFIFVRFRDKAWQVQEPVEVNRHSAARFLWALFNLGQKGKPFSPEYLAGDGMVYLWTVADLFCGAGGFSMGFRDAGFELVCGIDNHEAAIRTNGMNLGGHAIKQDITEDTELPDSTVIVGGPPCQGFSSAGLRRSGDVRNTLVSCFAQVVARKRPLAFVFENVEGFLTAEGGGRILELLAPLIAAGYRIHLRKVNAANYGVPQHRKRVIAIGGLGWDPSFPNATHSAYGAPGARLAGMSRPLTPSLEDALRSLPSASTTEPGLPSGHYYRPLSGVELERARALKPGQTMRDLPGELWHDSYRRRAYRRVMDGTPTERRGGAPAGVRRLRPDEPCKAITSGALAEFLHPAEDRGLTLRECARLQTFPDDFVFAGGVSEAAQLIGNAVPPLLAGLIARSLRKDLEMASPAVGKGALLSFLPTLSKGKSPALKQVTEMVRETFLRAKRSKDRLLWD
jgi:DNA (cytosine-5)-methyltransferase 1